jgi:putative transposase
MVHIPLEYGSFYHIYNRGINGCTVFTEADNYFCFLDLYQKYITPVANTYAWVLMRNHFHLLIKVKKENEIPFLPTLKGNLHKDSDENHLEETEFNKKKYNQTNQFSHLFNAYAKIFNKKYYRTGSLWEHPFRRIKIETLEQLLYLIYYIHHNPIHHGFCSHFLEYPWSSYLTMVSPKKTNLKRSEVLKWFNDINNFEEYQNKENISRFNDLKFDFLGDD